ncbi:MAG: SMC-Scp complex subunit ScpB [bacterium]|nr:SMC-Scp complex subunit ScpB [bacterium]
MDKQDLKNIIECFLFVTNEPIPIDRIARFFNVKEKPVKDIIYELKEEYNENNRGLLLIEVANGFQVATKPQYGKWVRNFFRLPKKIKLTKPTIETLSIIAFNQPIVKAEIEDIRGVEVRMILANLLEHDLIKIVGRKETIGRPLLYGTTDKFLKAFGLKDLSMLPKIEEIEEIFDDFGATA